jgi:hypothetical protein
MVNLDQAIKLKSKEELDREQRMNKLVDKVAKLLEKEKVSIYEMTALLMNIHLGFHHKLFTELNNKKND